MSGARPATAAARARWNERAARCWARATGDPRLGECIHLSQRLGADPALVLAGGGNTSVKSTWTDALGERRAALWVKASGADLATVGPGGFVPLDLEPVRRLAALARLDDRVLMRELRRLRLDPDAPAPSVETLLHAVLPARFVAHTHADAALAVLLAPDGRRRAEDLWGDDHVLVPYARPGHGLARRAAALWRAAERAGRRPAGLILLHHGVVACGAEARECYERMLAAVARARRALAPRVAVSVRSPASRDLPAWSATDLAALRQAISERAGRPLVAALDASAGALSAASDPALAAALDHGPLTPDHVLRTRVRPLRVAAPGAVARAVERWAARYRRDFERFRRGRDLAALDPAPRVAWLAGGGLLALGEDAAAAQLALAIARHTGAVAAAALRLGGYRPLGLRALLDFETWEPERAKLARAGGLLPLAGRVALVTGAARGIGRATVDALLAAGAAVVGVDLRASGRERADYLGVVADVTRPRAVVRAVEAAVRRFGGLDILVSNVGVFLAGPTVAELPEADWRRAFELNATSHFLLLRAAAPLLALAPGGGAVIVIGSRNVLAPGPGAAAYSASKAALTQLARVAALELAPRGVRVNVLHPDNVFDTDLWTSELLAARAARYGLSVEAYRRRNLLGREVRAADVGALAAALAGDLFRVTTGAQIPVDGGSDRVV